MADADSNPPEPVIVLYDLACTKGVCFSPVVWRIRLMLNYKRIPYKTVFLEFPDIKPTLAPVLPPQDANFKYTVPTIHHLPTNTYLTDSGPIAQFLETTFPSPPLTMTSSLGREIESKARACARVSQASVQTREANILSPRSQVHFLARVAEQGRRLEDLLATEDAVWTEMHPQLQEVSDLLQTNGAKGPYILGADPSYTDFFFAGVLQSARVIDEGVFQRYIKYPGFRRVYEACVPFMDRKD